MTGTTLQFSWFSQNCAQALYAWGSGVRLSQCPFASSPWKANSALCSWESGVGTKFLALSLSSSRSLFDVISEPGPTLYLPEADALTSTLLPRSGLLPESRIVGWGKGERRGEWVLSFSASVAFYRCCFFRRYGRVSCTSPSVRFCFSKRSYWEASRILFSIPFARTLLGIFPAMPPLFLISTHWVPWRNVGECGLLFVSGIPRDSTLNGHLTWSLNLLTFQLFSFCLFLEYLCLPPILGLFLIRGSYHPLERSVHLFERATSAFWHTAFSYF